MTDKEAQDWNIRGFTHYCANGCKVVASKTTLADGVDVYINGNLPEERVAADVAEAIAYHAMHIWPKFDGSGLGFPGYDCVTYHFHR